MLDKEHRPQSEAGAEASPPNGGPKDRVPDGPGNLLKLSHNDAVAA